MPIVTLRNVSLSYGHLPLLDKVNLILEPGERTCLIGRNGVGKSSLLRLIDSQSQPDEGEVVFAQGMKVCMLEQAVPEDTQASVFDVVLSGLGELGGVLQAYEALSQRPDHDEASLEQLYELQHQLDSANGWNTQQRVHTVLSRLQLDGTLDFADLSGGMKRRVLLAKALVLEPDLLLLDEPTNHLDIEAVKWLEQFLQSFKGSILFITHDRAFLRALATRIVEVDRGNLISVNGSYDHFVQHKEALLEAEARSNAVFDKKLADEEVWIRQGVKARRTRNEGRVRALEQLRRERMARRDKMGKASFATSMGEKSGKIVLRAKGIGQQYDGRRLFHDFSLEVMRGDKIALLGPNGCGKSTLLKVLLGQLQPEEGTVEYGTKLSIAYFDQLRAQLDENLTLQDNVGEGSDFIDLNGKRLHILSYLKNFLFSPERARSPISKLSGGERNRLLLAKLFSRPSNVLVMDEPTNDLDLESLELLEDLLVNYNGTLLLVSHDRTFINHVATSTLVFEGNGELQEYVGGYDDWLRQRKTQKSSEPRAKKSVEKTEKKAAPQKLSYKQQRRLESLPQEIEEAEAAIAGLHDAMAQPDFYQQDKATIKQQQDQLSELEQQLDSLYTLWDELQ